MEKWNKLIIGKNRSFINLIQLKQERIVNCAKIRLHPILTGFNSAVLNCYRKGTFKNIYLLEEKSIKNHVEELRLIGIINHDNIYMFLAFWKYNHMNSHLMFKFRDCI